MRPVAACVILAGAALPFAAQAIEPFQIRDIRVEGLQRTDPGSVFSVLPFRVARISHSMRQSPGTALRTVPPCRIPTLMVV